MSGFASLPVVGGFFDDSAEQGMGELAKNQELWNNIKVPDEVWKDYAPDNYTAKNADYQQIQSDPAVQSAQMSALQQLAGLSQNGLSDVDQAAFAKARNEAGQMQNQNLGAALSNAESRGVSGSGMEFAMREMAGQNAANQAQNANLQQAADSAKQRALYAQAYGDQLGSVRNQNFQQAQANSNIVNQFNMANTQAQNAASQYNVGNQNQAQQLNNQGHLNTQQQNFNNQVTKAGGQAQANTGMAGGFAAQNAANTSTQNALLGAGANAYGAYEGAQAKKPANNDGYGG